MTSWTLVGSSNVAAVSTDGPDLLVKFHGQETDHYRYHRAGHLFGSMIEAESVGKFLNTQVKPAYTFTREGDG